MTQSQACPAMGEERNDENTLQCKGCAELQSINDALQTKLKNANDEIARLKGHHRIFEPLLMSRENPHGWPLENLLQQLATEIEQKTARIVGDSSPVAGYVVNNNVRIYHSLLHLRSLQLDSIEALKQLGPDKGPNGQPRIGLTQEGA